MQQRSCFCGILLLQQQTDCSIEIKKASPGSDRLICFAILAAHGTCGMRNIKKESMIRRLFSKKLSRKTVTASMTVEASLVLPLLLFFFMNVLFAFDMMRLQSNMTAALHQTGQQITEYAFYYRYGLKELLSGERRGEDTDGAGQMEGKENAGVPEDVLQTGMSFLAAETYVRGQVNAYLGTGYLNHTCLSGGEGSISYLRSNILTEGDIVELTADYRVRPLIRVLGLQDFSMESHYYAHAWTGYEIGSTGENVDGTEESYCFLTETGTVYHLSRGCTYLNPSIKGVQAAEVEQCRNNAGAKYYACESCKPVRKGTLYITEDGNRYHSTTGCSGLKRTVREVPLSQVKDCMPACSKCGG